MSDELIRFRNENTEEVVEAAPDSDLYERLTGLDNWHRLDGQGETVELGDEDMTIEEIEAELSEAETADLVQLYGVVRRLLVHRGVTLPSEDRAEDEGPTDPTAKDSSDSEGRNADGEVEGDDDSTGTPAAGEVDATDAAAKLAEDEGIDLRTVTGSGEDGRITIGDVREAVAAKDSSDSEG